MDQLREGRAYLEMHKNVVEWESSEVRGKEPDLLESLGLHS